VIHGRYEILQKLINLKVDVTVQDCHEKTPLFYAAGNGDGRSVIQLLDGQDALDDGSLHEAARLCNSGIVAMLLEKGFNVNSPSHLHNGQNVLGELCFKASLSTKQQESDAQRAMGYFIQGLDRTDLSFRIDGRTVLHLAFAQ
jgi:ankyrin repeat protein